MMGKIPLHITVLSVVLSGVMADDLPCILAPPCTCNYNTSHVDCSHKGLTDVPQLQNVSITQKWYIDLSYNDFVSIPDGALENIPILGLFLQHNQISSLGNNVFSGNEDIMFKLYLHFNNITELPVAIAKLRAVYDLTLHGNPIQDYNTGIFLGMSNTLNKFAFGSSSLVTWPKMLQTLTRATLLTLYGLQITSLPADAFPDRLFILNITDSGITSLSNSLNNKEDLFELDLQNNQKLTSQGLAEGGFQNLTGLRTISIINCGIDTLPGIFDQMPILSVVISIGNPITDLQDITFPDNFASMDQLTIRDSLLQRIPPTVSHLVNLNEIDITNSKITTITETDFSVMRKLRTMYLSSNAGLTNISDNALKSQEELESLYLANTPLTTIPKAIQNTPKLGTLNLSNAKIECSCGSLGWMKDWLVSRINPINFVGNCVNTSKSIQAFVQNDLPNC